MHVARITADEDFEALSEAWQALSDDVPFRGWAWNRAWWRHYQDAREKLGSRELYVLVVRDSSEAVRGIAPWFVERQPRRGGVVQFLGSGHACADYVSILCEPADQTAVTGAIAAWLRDSQRTTNDCWDLLELDGVAAADPCMNQFLTALDETGYEVERRPGLNCWRAELPATWEEMIRSLSKNYRTKAKRITRQNIESGEVKSVLATTDEEVRRGVEILIELHQRRWKSLGEPGCFASSAFTGFHREVIQRWHQTGELRLWWLEANGMPIACEYQVVGGDTAYAYQSGIEPSQLDLEPGRTAQLIAMRHSLESGVRYLDFMRGDEPYKATWRADPVPMLNIRVVGDRFASRLRHGVTVAGEGLKDWIRSGLHLAGLR